MTTSDRIWMTRRAYIRLQAELASLQGQPKLEVPEDIMDHDANRIAASRAVPTRIRRIEHLLANAVVGEDPPDNGVAEPGMVLTIRHRETRETETFLLGVRGTETAEVEVYSPDSPLGRAITGAHPGERRTYCASSGNELEVTLLRATPYGRYARGGGRRVRSGHSGSRRTSRVLNSLVMKGSNMTSTQRIWISADAYEGLHQELATLRRLCATAAEDEDTRENATAIQRARQARIQQIHDLLVYAVVGEDPPNDGIAEPGMVISVRYDDTGDTESFLLGVRGAEHSDTEVYSIQSPLGAAILGARPGEQRTFKLPSGAELSVTMLAAVPYGLHTAELS